MITWPQVTVVVPSGLGRCRRRGRPGRLEPQHELWRCRGSLTASLLRKPCSAPAASSSVASRMIQPWLGVPAPKASTFAVTSNSR